VLVVFAITAASMLAMVGLLFSFGVVLAQRRALQTAADAASLSGSWTVMIELASDDRRDAEVLKTVQKFAQTNGVPSTGPDAPYVWGVYVDASGVPVLPSTSIGSGGAFPATARGVRVTVKNSISTILPNFLNVWSVLVQDSATSAARPTAGPDSAPYVIPVAVLATDMQTAYLAHAAYDLFAHPLSGGQAPTLNLAATPGNAPSFGTLPTNLRYWSDGQHSGSWTLSQPNDISLAGGTYYDSVAAGLQDNIRRQALTDANGKAYALVTVPVYQPLSGSAVHVVGFAQFKVLSQDIKLVGTTWSAIGRFVPYTVGAWGSPSVPTIDLGATLIVITS
jgi:hypothetical protein